LLLEHTKPWEDNHVLLLVVSGIPRKQNNKVEVLKNKIKLSSLLVSWLIVEHHFSGYL